MSDDFPLGVYALHPDWPDAQFSVSGLMCHAPLLFAYFQIVEMGFGCRPPIAAVYDAPAVPWNGGRLKELSFGIESLARITEAFNLRNVGCFLTFTNHLLERRDLEDPTCNELLDCIAQRPDINGVVVASALLSQYVERKHPELRRIASVIKVTMEEGRGNPRYYQDLGARFNRYVVHPDDCRDLGLLDQLDRCKAEILVNENCLRGCSTRAQHYDAIARAQKDLRRVQSQSAEEVASRLASCRYASSMQELEQAMAGCGSTPLMRQIGRWQRNCNLTRGELKTLYGMGFRFLKLQGRTDNVFGYAYDLVRYTLEPDVAAPLVYKTICPVITADARGPAK